MHRQIKKTLSFNLVILTSLFLVYITKNIPINSGVESIKAATTPIISSVSGDISNGGTVTISGSNFGSHSLDISSGLGSGGWIEQASAGSDFDSLPASTGWDVGLSSDSSKPIISNERFYSGQKAALGRVDNAANSGWQSVMRYTHQDSFDKFYISYWMYWDPISYSSTGNTQFKMIRVNHNGITSDQTGQFYFNSVIKSDGSPYGFNWWAACALDCSEVSYTYCNSQAQPIPYYSPLHNNPYNYGYLNKGQTIPFTDSLPTPRQWNKVELYVDRGTMDNFDGEFILRVRKPNGDLVFTEHMTQVNMQRSELSCRNESAPWTSFQFQNFFDDNGGSFGAERADFFYDDIYLQFGTGSRVELCDNSDYTVARKCETQNPQSWSSGNISIEMNYGGSFNTGDTAYLFVIHDDGGISSPYQITLSGQSDPVVSSSLLLYSTMDSATAILNPSTAQAVYSTVGQAIPGSDMVSYQSGYSGNATVFDGSGFDVSWPVDGPVRFKGENFDFDDPEGDGGRLDFKIKFNENPHTSTANTWIARTNWDQGLGVGDRLINYEFSGSPADMMIDVYSNVAHTDKTNYEKFRVLPRNWSVYENISQGQWHTFTFTWRNNGLHKDEIHFYIDGSQAGCESCSDYNGNLPPLNSITDFYFSPGLNGNYRQFSIDEVYSFDSWDTSSVAGAIDLDRPEGVTITYPQNPDYPIYASAIGSNTPVFEFFVINEQANNFSCNLYVDGQFVRSLSVTNDSHSEVSSNYLTSGDHNMEIKCDNNRLTSGVRDFTISSNNEEFVCSSGQTRSCTTSLSCSGIETCSNNSWGTCTDVANDNCPAAADSGDNGGGGGGGGGGGANPPINSCQSLWLCDNWSSCQEGQSVRSCQDQNNCSNPSDRPLQSRSCTTGQNQDNQDLDQVPKAPTTASPGSQPSGALVKVAGSSTVYYIGTDYKKYVFPDANTYFSWFENFDNVKLVSSDDLDKYEEGGIMTYRPGTYLITSQYTAKVYAVSGYGHLYWIENEETAARLYGPNWTQRVRDISPGFLSTAYLNSGKSLIYNPVQTLYIYQGQYYLVVDAYTLKKISTTGLIKNNFNTNMVIEINSLSGFSIEDGDILDKEDRYFYLR